MICSADAKDFSLFVQRGAHYAVGGWGEGGGEGMQTLLICKKKKINQWVQEENYQN